MAFSVLFRGIRLMTIRPPREDPLFSLDEVQYLGA
jgi:hypothetical protein